MRSRRTVLTVAAWCACTALSIGVSWFALRPVLGTAVPDRTAPLTASELRQLAPMTVPVSPPPASPSSRPASPRPSTAAPTAARTVRDGWTVSGGSYLRSFHVDGGDAMVRVEPGRVRLVSATPRPTWTVHVEQNQPDRLIVRFLKGQTVFLIDAMWWEERPFAQVSRVG